MLTLTVSAGASWNGYSTCMYRRHAMTEKLEQERSQTHLLFNQPSYYGSFLSFSLSLSLSLCENVRSLVQEVQWSSPSMFSC